MRLLWPFTIAWLSAATLKRRICLPTAAQLLAQRCEVHSGRAVLPEPSALQQLSPLALRVVQAVVVLRAGASHRLQCRTLLLLEPQLLALAQRQATDRWLHGVCEGSEALLQVHQLLHERCLCRRKQRPLLQLQQMRQLAPAVVMVRVQASLRRLARQHLRHACPQPRHPQRRLLQQAHLQSHLQLSLPLRRLLTLSRS